jgi:hypothetical protein
MCEVKQFVKEAQTDGTRNKFSSNRCWNLNILTLALYLFLRINNVFFPKTTPLKVQTWKKFWHIHIWNRICHLHNMDFLSIEAYSRFKIWVVFMEKINSYVINKSEYFEI